MSEKLSPIYQEIEAEKISNAKRKIQELELLSLKRPTKIDDIRVRIPAPKNPLPINALPEWKDRRLDSKFPAIPAPDGTFAISQGVLGERLFVAKCHQEFDMSDPLIIQTPLAYDALHDPNLREFFQANPLVCQRLVQLGLVNNEGRVLCSLHEFNKYRMYLSRIHNSDVAREKERMESWERCEHEHVKQLKQYIDREIKRQADEERRRRMEKNLADIKARNKLIKLRELEHPCNYIKEKRTIEAKLRKIKRDAVRKTVLNRLKRIHEAEARRTRHLILEWICKDEFREKLRNVIKLEKEVNRQEDLAYFVDTKRNFQEKKLRYQRALLKRNKVETECKVMRRYDSYLKQRIESDRRTIAIREMMDRKAKRQYYLMEKYGHRWLALTRKYSSNPLHTSTWHIRNILHAMVQYVKLESGARSFSGFLSDVINLKNKKAEIDPETLTAVTSILDILVNRSYKEFIKRATSCLVDYVMDEARKKCLKQCCEEEIDQSDLESPIYSLRNKSKIVLPRPDYPCSGPCSQFRKGPHWPCSCAQELEWFHGQLCVKLLKKLTKKMKRMTCTQDNLENLETRVKQAKGSPFVRSAIDRIFGTIVRKPCDGGPHPRKHRKQIDGVANDLVTSVLGPEFPKRGQEGHGPLRSAKGQKDESTHQKQTDKRKVGPDASAMTGLPKPRQGRVRPEQSTGTDTSAGSDSEAGGIPIAPVLEVSTPRPRTQGQGRGKPLKVIDESTNTSRPGGSQQLKQEEIQGTDYPIVVEQGSDGNTPDFRDAVTDGNDSLKDNETTMPPLSLVEKSTEGVPNEDKGIDGVSTLTENIGVGEPSKLENQGMNTESGVNQGTEVTPPDTTEAENQEEPLTTDVETEPPRKVNQTTDTNPPTSKDKGNQGVTGVDQETDRIVPDNKDKETQEEFRTNDGETEPQPRLDQGTNQKPADGTNKDTQHQPPIVDDSTEPQPRIDEGTEKEPPTVQDSGNQKESTIKENATGMEPLPESKDEGSQGKPPSTTVRDSENQSDSTGVDKGVDKPSPDSREEGSQKNPPTTEAETISEMPDRSDRGTQPPRDVEKGTEAPPHPSLVDKTTNESKPSLTDTQTGTEKDPNKDVGTKPEGTRTQTIDVRPPVKPVVEKGTKTDDSQVHEISETPIHNVVDNSTETEPRPSKSTENIQKDQDQGVGPSLVNSESETPILVREEESVEQRTEETPDSQGVDGVGPLNCDNYVGPMESCTAWDNVQISENELSGVVSENVNHLLCDLTSKMIQECVDSGGVGAQGAQTVEEPCNEIITDYDLSRSISCHINELLDRESCLQGAEQVLRGNCLCLESPEAIDKCLEKSSKKLREACHKLTDCCDEAKCLEEAKNLWPPTCGDRKESDEELSMAASNFIDCILAEQKSKLCNELLIVGSGDEREITAILSADNVSRISSAMVRDALCRQVCPQEVLEEAKLTGSCLSSPSPVVRGSVRDKLDHIRAILDDIKIDLAQVGIRPQNECYQQQQPSTSQSAQVPGPIPNSLSQKNENKKL